MAAPTLSLKTIAHLEQEEARLVRQVTHVTHVIGEQGVRSAVDPGRGLRPEELRGVRQTSTQRTETHD